MASTVVETRDRISELPKNVIDLILERMPINDAVSTSALSRDWRYNWTTISNLLFDMTFFAYLKTKRLQGVDSVRFIITNILLLHNGPIVSFHLHLPFSSCDHVGNFINFLSRKGVKKLTLATDKSLLDCLPSHIYSCVELTHLNIVGCTFNFPPNFRGFPKLNNLELHNFKFEVKSFGDFITSCPLHESMTLTFNPCIPGHLNVRSRSLKLLSVQGLIGSICIDANGLETLSISSYTLLSENLRFLLGVGSMVKTLAKVPKIEKLSLGGRALKNLATSFAPLKLPAPLKFLKDVDFTTINFDDAAEIGSVLCIMRSAPALQQMQISPHIRTRTDVVEPVSSFPVGDDITLSCLKVVKFVHLRGSRSELEMIRYILASSPSLEKIFVKTRKGMFGEEPTKIFTELMRFIRVSPKAEMIYSEWG